MKIWSKGLGTMVLNMNFKNYYVVIEDGKLLIKGQITDPVIWFFVITIEKDDIRGLANIVLKGRFLAYLGRNIRYFFIFFFEKLFKRKAYEYPKDKIEIPDEVFEYEASLAKTTAS